MAMARALHLARDSTDNNGPVLVATFNNTLVAHLKFLASEEDAEQLRVESYHTFARGYLNSVGRMPAWGGIVPNDDNVEVLVARAKSAVKEVVGEHPIFSRPSRWFADEIHWLSGMNITTEGAYQVAERISRQTPLQGGLPRSIVWAVRDGYHAQRASRGFVNDWYDLGGLSLTR